MPLVSTLLGRRGYLTAFAVVVVFGIVAFAVLGSTTSEDEGAAPDANPPAVAAGGREQAPAPTGAVATAREIIGPSPVVPLAGQPDAKIIIDQPLWDPLARGLVVIQYRTENLRIMPVFGSAALAVSPRIGHLHVTLDDAPWVWAHTSGDDLIINGLPPGPHKILLEAMTANHQPLAKGVVKFEVPARSVTKPGLRTAASVALAEQPVAKLMVDPPQPDRLAKGVVFIECRTENLRILPVFGPAALAISPRIGHLHVTVDDAPWRWANTSGGPVIVDGLPLGPHKILIELVDANHRPLAQDVVKFEVP
jgi:hypothetical protein